MSFEVLALHRAKTIMEEEPGYTRGKIHRLVIEDRGLFGALIRRRLVVRKYYVRGGLFPTECQHTFSDWPALMERWLIKRWL